MNAPPRAEPTPGAGQFVAPPGSGAGVSQFRFASGDFDGESATFSCVALPSACKDDPSCECLETVDDDDSNLDWSLSFCLMEGSCGLDDEVLRVGCPGG